MANAKTGFDYYKVDTDRYQDRRIKKLRKNFGCVGLAVYDYLLCEIYRDKGCFSVWDDDCAFDVAEYLGIKESTVIEVVKYCGVVGLFDEALLSGGIVTSKSIQRRFVEMSNAARRQSCDIPAEIRLTEELPKMQEECGDNVGRIAQNVGRMYEECRDSSNILTQSKVKYSKEKKRKENISLSISPSCEGDESQTATASVAERERIFLIFFLKNFKNPEKEVERFYAHYEAVGWRRNGGLPITDRIALATTWEAKPEDMGRFSPKVAKFWAECFTAVKDMDFCSLVGHELVAVEEQPLKLTLAIRSKRLMEEMEARVQTIAPIFQNHFPATKLAYRLPN